MWQTIVEASSVSEFEALASQVQGELNVGQRGKVEIELAWWPDWLEAPVEWAIESFSNALSPLDVTVEDAEFVGDTLIIYFRGSPVLWVPLLLAIAAVLFGLAFLVIAIKVSKEVSEWGTIAIVVGGMVVVGGLTYALIKW